MDDIPTAKPRYAARALGVFAHRAFATIWLANLAALIGVAMYDAASGWMIVKYGSDPGMVSMLRAAINMPMFLVTLVAGAMADLFDARRLLIGISAGIAALVAIFGALVALGLADSAVLLTTTFLLSAAVSLAAPAWLAIAPRLVAATIAGAPFSTAYAPVSTSLPGEKTLMTAPHRRGARLRRATSR